jgi:CheY-specific phosphatase CheX
LSKGKEKERTKKLSRERDISPPITITGSKVIDEKKEILCVYLTSIYKRKATGYIYTMVLVLRGWRDAD